MLVQNSRQGVRCDVNAKCRKVTMANSIFCLIWWDKIGQNYRERFPARFHGNVQFSQFAPDLRRSHLLTSHSATFLSGCLSTEHPDDVSTEPYEYQKLRSAEWQLTAGSPKQIFHPATWKSMLKVPCQKERLKAIFKMMKAEQGCGSRLFLGRMPENCWL